MADNDSLPKDTSRTNTDSVQEDTINPLSSNFNPIAALNAVTVPGVETVDALHNLQQFEEYQANPQLFLQSQAERKEKDTLRKAAKEKNAIELQAMKSAPKPTRIVKNVLTRMQRIEGPTALLQGWIQSRTKVKVITRSFKSVRGTCTGFVLAFDRYLNLAMVDVDETYSSIHTAVKSTKQKKGRRIQSAQSTDNACNIACDKEPELLLRGEVAAPLNTGNTRNSVCDTETDLLVRRVEAMHVAPSDNIQHRHVNQLFIRGDNVVSISSCS